MTRWAQQREGGSPLALRALLWLALRLGPRPTRWLLPPLVMWYLATAAPARHASREYLDRALGRPATWRDITRHFGAFAAAVLERVYLLAGHAAAFRIETEGLAPIHALLAEGRGCVLLGAHHGSFEVLRGLAREAPVPVRPLMYRRNAGALTALLDQLAPGLRDAVIEIGQPGAMLAAKEALDRGEMVGLLADRTPGGERTVTVPFLGAPAAFPAGPFLLAATLGAPVVLFYGLRTGTRRYRVVFQPFADPLLLRRSHRAEDLHAAVARYAQSLEAQCRAWPYNWFNFYPFWEAPDAAAPRPAAAAPAAPRPGGERAA
jgi:predicted LPLAT superfamily acyltransferase